MENIIEISNISKSYQLGQIGSGTLIHDFNGWIARVFNKPNPNQRLTEHSDTPSYDNPTLIALDDINLSINRGEVLGIIGSNGAGKSTLLKILSKITSPTKGTIKIRGTISSLLEVGTGFHPEMTGRENIYMNGTILGMKKSEIDRKIDEIIHFAQIDTFIETPVKRYSSGMLVRLGFSIAAHLEPDILIIDEVLAVGDVKFQKKAIGKIKGLTEDQGRTVLFVSHNMGAISTLCDRVLWLEHGKVREIGSVGQVIDKYMDMQLGISNTNIINSSNFSYSGIDEISASIISEGTSIQISDDIKFNLYYSIRIDEVHIEVRVKGYDGNILFVSRSVETYNSGLDKNSNSISFIIPKNFLNTQYYYIDLLVIHKNEVVKEFKDLIGFNVIPSLELEGSMANPKGYIKPEFKWHYNQ